MKNFCIPENVLTKSTRFCYRSYKFPAFEISAPFGTPYFVGLSYCETTLGKSTQVNTVFLTVQIFAVDVYLCNGLSNTVADGTVVSAARKSTFTESLTS